MKQADAIILIFVSLALIFPKETGRALGKKWDQFSTAFAEGMQP